MGLGLLALGLAGAGALGWLGIRSGAPFAGLSHPGLSAALAPCGAVPEAGRASCAFTVLRSEAIDLDLTGVQAAELCARIEGSDSHGWCVDYAMGLRQPPPLAACDPIEDPDVQASCRLRRTDRDLAGATLAEAVDLCRALEALQDHCFAHIATERSPHWARGGLSFMRQELQELLTLAPELQQSQRFGTSIRHAVRSSGERTHALSICLVFEDGSPAQGGCMAFRRDEGRGEGPR